MSNNIKKTFLSNLLVALIIISNLVGVKYTIFNGLIISANFITLPFVYLCLLLIHNFTNKKEMWISLFSSVLVQIILLLFYFSITNFNAQNIIPDLGTFMDIIFKVDIGYIIINLLSLIVSCFVLHYIYEYFRIIGYNLLGTVLAILSGLVLYGLISIPFINYEFGIAIILDMIMGHLLISVLMTILITVAFYLIKEKEYPYNESKLFIKDIELQIPKNKIDKPIDEVIKITSKKNKKNLQKKTSNDKKQSKTKVKKDSKNNNTSKKDVKK